MANTNGDGVKITRATLAMILALSTPLATVAIVGYQVRQHEAGLADLEARTRLLERAVIQMEHNSAEIREQSVQIAELRKEVRELMRQLDRVR